MLKIIRNIWQNDLLVIRTKLQSLIIKNRNLDPYWSYGQNSYGQNVTIINRNACHNTPISHSNTP